MVFSRQERGRDFVDSQIMFQTQSCLDCMIGSLAFDCHSPELVIVLLIDRKFSQELATKHCLQARQNGNDF